MGPPPPFKKNSKKISVFSDKEILDSARPLPPPFGVFLKKTSFFFMPPLNEQSTLWVCKEKSLYTRNCEKKLGWTKELKMRQPACSWDRLCWLFPPACRIIELCDLVWQSHYLGDNNQGFTYPVKLVGVVVATQYTCDNMNFLYEATCCVHSFKG